MQAFEAIAALNESGAKKLRTVAVFTAFFPPAVLGGGPVRTLSALVANAPSRINSLVVTRNTDLGVQHPMPVVSDEWVALEGSSRVVYISEGSNSKYRSALRLVRAASPDVVYLNSFFGYKFSIIPQLLVRFGAIRDARVVLAPRGEFGDGALAIRSPKKRVFLSIHRLLGLRRRVIWHASSDAEAADIRRTIGSRATVVIRENETELPSKRLAIDPPEGSFLRAVHLSRLVPIKGLDILLAELAHVDSTILLDVYGPEEDRGFVARCRSLATGVPANVTVNFRGPIVNDLVRSTLAQYDLMLMPTRGENFGHVIAEALSAACPVMCADTTPWTETLSDGGGVVVDESPGAGWARAIDAYAQRGREGWDEGREQAWLAFERWKAGSKKHRHLYLMLEDLL